VGDTAFFAEPEARKGLSEDSQAFNLWPPGSQGKNGTGGSKKRSKKLRCPGGLS